MPRFSLVVATFGRTDDLGKLLLSIAGQRRGDIEIILVDQNQDSRIDNLLQGLRSPVSVLHLRTEVRDVSRARNLGLDAASGQIIAFPDDDCWYPAGLLDEIDQCFQTHPQYSIFATGALDDDGIPSGNRWIQDACDITPFNSLRTTFCSSLFISAVEQSRIVRFDERLNRGEETDFVLRLLATGLRGRFDRRLHIHHPRRDMLSGTVSRERAFSYGAGMGRLVRRHSLFVLWVLLLIYDLARAVLVTLKGRLRDAGFCFAHAQGLTRGFVLPNAQD
ncbi:MAG TPA: glycosyltransferase family 2 protein [Bryobacteraceae bacterium]|jgi:glycosyltransferase involved in cell wall biosynthesis|nr:glycosyltransferase family 2 protein [Bryobacteraceae bacterium]